MRSSRLGVASDEREPSMKSHGVQDHNQIAVRRSTFKTASGLVASLLFVALFAFVAMMVASRTSAPFTYFTTSESLVIAVFMSVGAIMATALSTFYLQRLISPNPLLVIDNDGITDRTSWFSVGLILWREIAVILAKGRYLLIVPRDIEPILARQHPIKRAVLSINVRLTRGRIIIAGPLLSMPTSAVLAQATSRYSNSILEHSIEILVAR